MVYFAHNKAGFESQSVSSSSNSPREFSPNIIRRIEQPYGLDVTADGFPAEITDDEPESEGYEIKLR